MLKNVNNFISSFKSKSTENRPKSTAQNSRPKPSNLIEILQPKVDAQFCNNALKKEDSLSRSQSGTSVYQENCNLRQICLTFEHIRCESYHNYLKFKQDYPTNVHNSSLTIANNNRFNNTSLRAITSEDSVSCKGSSLSNITDAVLYLRTAGVKVSHSTTTATRTATAATTNSTAIVNVSRSITTTSICNPQSRSSPYDLFHPNTHPQTLNQPQQNFLTLPSHHYHPQSNLHHRSLSEYSFGQNDNNYDKNWYKIKSTSFEPIPEQNFGQDNRETDTRSEREVSKKMLSPEVSNSSSVSKLPSYIRLSKTISGYGACKHYNLDEHTYERAKSSSSRHSDVSDQFRSLPYDALLNQFQNTRNNDNSSPNMPASSSSSSFLQKKIASLYGNSFADDWQRSRSKSRQSNGSSERSPRSPSCPPARIAESREFAKNHKEFSPKDLLKQMKDERMQQKTAQQNKHIDKQANNEDKQVQKLEQNIVNVEKAQKFIDFEGLASNNNNNNNNDPSNVQQLQSTESQVINIVKDREDSFEQINTEMQGNDTSQQEYEKFLRFIHDTRQEFQQQIEKYERLLVEIDTPELQEGMGKVRATIGKANLLLSKKMNQFEKLCNDSLNQTGNEAFTIKNDDLQGFWDMLSIQIDEVRNGFLNLKKLEDNNWNSLPDEIDSIYQSSPTSRGLAQSPTTRKLRHGATKGSPTKNNSITSAANTNTDSERKARLNEIKRKAKQRMLANQADKAEEEIYIFAPAGQEQQNSVDAPSLEQDWDDNSQSR